MSFALPSDDPALDPRPIVARLIAECPDFEDLRLGEARVAVFMRTERHIRGTKQTLGMMALPRWQGSLAPLATWMLEQVLGEMPHFIMVLDAEWWLEAPPRNREALVFHELKHAMHSVDKDGERRFTPDGLPAWAIREHDVTAFNAEVTRYGAWSEDIRAFLSAAGANRL
jgi:hypothetical protein